MVRLGLLAIATALMGCADCAQSAAVQVTLAPASDVAVAQVTRIEVTVTVGDDPEKRRDISVNSLAAGGNTLVLVPDPPAERYPFTVMVRAFDTTGQLLAAGSQSQQVSRKGCNRLNVPLMAMGGMSLPDASPGDDLSVFDGSVMPADLSSTDMAGCSGPDEDGDGRANACDACPADPDPMVVDSDADGLPDACDPDPARAGNVALYFEPFDTVSSDWGGYTSIAGSTMELDATDQSSTQRIAFASNAFTQLPQNLRVQAMVSLPNTVTSNAAASIFVGTNANQLASNASGVRCELRAGLDKRTLSSLVVDGGQPVTANTVDFPFSSPFNIRLRLTQRGSQWVCEAKAASGELASTAAVKAVSGSLFIAFRAQSTDLRVYSCVAQTTLP